MVCSSGGYILRGLHQTALGFFFDLDFFAVSSVSAWDLASSTKMADSGWKLIKDSLYVRQIGNIVCIQGSTKTIHLGTVFTIPNTIAAPSHAVKHTIGFANNRTWVSWSSKHHSCLLFYQVLCSSS